MRRAIEIVALVACIATLPLLGWLSQGSPPSTYSSYDGGVNGYEALYNVLAREGVDVRRSTDPMGLLASDVRVLVATPVLGFGGDLSDTTVRALQHKHVRVVVFTLQHAAAPKGTIQLNASDFTNVALESHPENALRAYQAIAGDGPVAFDEYRQGFQTNATMWSVLPQNVRIACFIAIAALLLALVGANIRHRPAIEREPPQERDSSAYIVSMARLLRRAGAPHVAPLRKDHS